MGEFMVLLGSKPSHHQSIFAYLTASVTMTHTTVLENDESKRDIFHAFQM
jgi:hypothetical protein